MTTLHTSTPLKPPVEHVDHPEFWTAARESRLLVKHCTECGKPHWYPRVLCPYCLGATEWKQASGRGTIYTYSVTRRAGPTPFCVAYVRLEEGVTLLTQIVDCDLDTVRIGQKVVLRFTPTEDNGPPVPTFTLA